MIADFCMIGAEKVQVSAVLVRIVPASSGTRR
jgi:hypothetical protein